MTPVPGPYVHVYDSVPALWPPEADFLLAYDDGARTSHNFAEARSKRPYARIIQCTTTGRPGVRVIDVESGDSSVPHAALLVHSELAAKRRPWLYCSDDTRGTLETALHHLAIAPTDLDWWEANPDGAPVVNPGWQAHQYAWSAAYDTSVALLSAACLT